MDAAAREVTREKAALRRELAARLAALDPGARARSAAAAGERLLALPEVAGARRIFTCLAFGDELDTWGLVDTWLASGREVYIPRADRRDGQIHVHRYPCALRTLAFGLRQPPDPRRGDPPSTQIPDAEIDTTLDVAVVLGLGFDRRGYRLGYGSGYFDRFLRGGGAGRPFPAVGLAFETQLLERLPVAPHDVPMSVIVSAREVTRPIF